jgi:hypothetical protein
MRLDHLDTNDTTIYCHQSYLTETLTKFRQLFGLQISFGEGRAYRAIFHSIPSHLPHPVYSLPLTLVDFIASWDAGNEAMGEDLHMYIKCSFAKKGNLTCRTVFSAASQSNVHSCGKGIEGYIRNCNDRYRQA